MSILQFQAVPSRAIVKICSKTSTRIEKSLQQKFEEKKKELVKKHGCKIRKYHFMSILHEDKLIVLDGNGKIYARLSNPESRETIIKARQIYVEEIRKSNKQEGGCYFN